MHSDVVLCAVAKQLGLAPDNYQSWSLLHDALSVKIDRLKAQLKTAKRDAILEAVRLTRTSYTEGGSEWLCPVNDLINYANTTGEE